MSQQAQFMKWTTYQDEKLLNAIKKCGVQWRQVYSEIGKTRSQNSIIKRWHGHLKQTVDLKTFWKNTNFDSKGLPKIGKEEEKKEKVKIQERKGTIETLRKLRGHKTEEKEKQSEENEAISEKSGESEEKHQSSEMEEQEESKPVVKKQKQKQKSEKAVMSEEENNSQLEREKEEKHQQMIKKITSQDYSWTKKWSEEDDNKFRNYVVEYHILEWEKISQLLLTSVDEIKHRWYKVVFPKMRNTVKIGGSVKWCPSQDSILFGAHKKQISFLDLMHFLPGRTIYSMEARWRRIARNYDLNQSGNEIEIPKTNSKSRNEILFNIATIRRTKKRQAMLQIIKREKEMIEAQKRELEKYKSLERQEKMRKQR